MSDELTSILEQQTACLPQPSLNQAGFCFLSDWRYLIVEGEDAASFLQNLLTNDVNQCQPGQAQLTGFCQAKGRLLGIFWLIRNPDNFFLVLSADQQDFIRQRLDMFRLRSKITIQNGGQPVIGFLDQTTPLPDTAQIQNNLAIAVMDTDILAKLIEETTLIPRAQADWQTRLVKAGLPQIYAITREKFTAQQVNLDTAGGVSFRKGCYPGQEVVARLHYLGEAKRRLFTGFVQTEYDFSVGEDILTEDGSIAGQLVQYGVAENNTWILQMTLKLSMAEHTLKLADGTPIKQVSPLPRD
ncbi:Folate-dependent protein for Fe/S cluster synthesis/repair in oxidative stress [Methylophaga frappieri]|uniref:Folate-dependent protein for Fe/S cluster synthesis/repair in oxidative stress n=1 Tax=Methylophaga frappieri (strain ATCC BAA-2434 / DSM 25690 / JAM7) TaxID=754477 RepID=I1YFB4_METFJ|nr:folate-binding protein YgfZ [Methylophaga frappieri]AFJ01607.1 Folate-dependent protein for Fe/S cluster synthesis/repair in oxidative stress [Methylophaga frappieri]